MKITLFVLLLASVLLSFSLTLNYLFYKKSFLPHYAATLDPIGLEKYPTITLPKKTDLQQDALPLKVMFYGDSRALSWPNPRIDSYLFFNRAIRGQTSIQVSTRFQTHVVPLAPDILIIQLCVNDLKLIPLFPEKKEDIIQHCKKNLHDIVQQAQHVKIKVILTTIFPLGDVSFPRKILGIREQPIIDAIDDVNRFIRSLADNQTVIFDTYALLKSSETRKIYGNYSLDWLHLNKSGYKVLNRKLIKLVTKISKE
jgi:lysophospholipase L1-like esterase